MNLPTPIPTPPPIRRALLKNGGKHKLPSRVFPWRRLSIVVMAGAVIGNGCVTLWSYAVGREYMSAWAGHTAQSTPSAINDILLATMIMLLGLYLLKRE